MQYTMKYRHGHIEVYDRVGTFLFSADNEWEARSIMDGHSVEELQTASGL